MSWFVSLVKAEWQITKGDYDLLRLSYEVVPKEMRGKPDELQFIRHCSLEITIARTLSAIWSLDGLALEAQLVQHAIEFITKQLKKGRLAETGLLELSTSNSLRKHS